MRRLPIPCALALALLASAARGQIDRPNIVLDGATWARQPSDAALDAAKPQGVRSRGYVILKCGVTADGGLTDCARFMEDPKDRGFAAAALSLVPQFQLAPRAARFAHEAGATVIVQFNWRGEGGPCYPPYCSFIPPPPPPAGAR